MGKKILSLLLISLILFSTGCTSNKNSLQNQDRNNSLKVINPKPSQENSISIKKKEKASYIYTVPIKYDYENLTIDNISCTIAQLSGLKDSSIENKINKKIKENFKDALQEYKNSIAFKVEYASAHINTFYNNLINLSISAGYNDYIDSSLYDLESGKEIPLSALFTKGTDYVKLLNSKVIEHIASNGYGEEELLYGPFTTISKKQSFILLPEELRLIFKKDEANFNNYYSLGIPLAELDDYLDIIEKSPCNFNIYKNPEFINKYNNLSIFEKGKIEMTPMGKLQITYPKIIDRKYPETEKLIEKFIDEKIEETIQLPEIQEKKPNGTNRDLGSFELYVSFNSYDYIGFSRSLNFYDEGMWNSDLSMNYIIDRKTGKEIDNRLFIEKYINTSPGNKESFETIVKNKLPLDSIRRIYGETEKIDSKYIFDYCKIFLTSYAFESPIGIMIMLKSPKTGDILALVDIDIARDLKVKPEEFLKLD